MFYPDDPALDMGPDGKFADPDPGQGDAGSVVPATGGLNSVFDELIEVITHAGLTPDKADLTQVRKAIEAIAAAQSVTAGAISGLTMGNRLEDKDHDITFFAGSAASEDGTDLIVLPERTKRLDAPWAAGDLGGGLFSGAIAADTTYHCFVIKNDSSGLPDCGFDTSASAANRPVGWSKYRRIGSIITDSLGNIRNFKQAAGFFFLEDVFISATFGARPAGTKTDFVTGVPIGVPMVALLSPQIVSSVVAGAYVELLPSPDGTDGGFRTYARDGVNMEEIAGFQMMRTTNSGVCSINNVHACTSMAVAVGGWWDQRE